MDCDDSPPLLTAAIEEGYSPPPLPPENPPPLPSPPPLPPSLSPPPSMQMSSPLTDWLDFDPGVGGIFAADDDEGAPPPSKKAKLDDAQGANSSAAQEPPNLTSDSDSLEEGEISDSDGGMEPNMTRVMEPKITTGNLISDATNSHSSFTSSTKVEADLNDILAQTVDSLLDTIKSQRSLDGESPNALENSENVSESFGGNAVSNYEANSTENSHEIAVEDAAEKLPNLIMESSEKISVEKSKNIVETSENLEKSSVENSLQNSEKVNIFGTENSDDGDEPFFMQQFEIIDDLGESEEDANEFDSDDLDEDEIDALLDEGLQVHERPRPTKDGEPVVPVEKEKVILKGEVLIQYGIVNFVLLLSNVLFILFFCVCVKWSLLGRTCLFESVL